MTKAEKALIEAALRTHRVLIRDGHVEACERSGWLPCDRAEYLAARRVLRERKKGGRK